MKKKIAIVVLLISSVLSSITLSADSNIQGTGIVDTIDTVQSSEIPQSDEGESFTTVDWQESEADDANVQMLVESGYTTGILSLYKWACDQGQSCRWSVTLGNADAYASDSFKTRVNNVTESEWKTILTSDTPYIVNWR